MSNNNKKSTYSNIIDPSNNQLILFNKPHNFNNHDFFRNHNIGNKIIENMINNLCKRLEHLTLETKCYLKTDINNPYYNNLLMNKEKNKKNRLLDAMDKKNNKQLVNIQYNKQHPNKQTSINNFLKDIDNEYFKLVDYYDVYYNKSIIHQHNLNYKIPGPMKIEKTKININVEINNLEDIIKLANDYPLKYDVEYNIDMKVIHDIKPNVIKLNNMIGMKSLKENVVDQILYFIQKLHINEKKEHHDFLHTVIYGPPGTGKTETSKIIGNIYSKLGILKKGTFTKVTRADLIAGYLGQTAIKTKNIIEKSLEGVLFIDEAYALGNSEKRDIFAKECIDTLCEALSDNKDKLMVIIAGYKEDLNKCFFSYNQGLNSRFTWRFNIDKYDYKELFLIFKKKVNEQGWKIKENVKDEWFNEKKDYFKFYGRDIETLFAKIKIAHSKRVFCLDDDKKRIITKKDMDNGFKLFTENEEVKSRVDKDFNSMKFMYM